MSELFKHLHELILFIQTSLHNLKLIALHTQHNITSKKLCHLGVEGETANGTLSSDANYQFGIDENTLSYTKRVKM